LPLSSHPAASRSDGVGAVWRMRPISGAGAAGRICADPGSPELQIFEIARAVCTWMRTQARLRSNTMAIKLRVEACQAISEKPIDTPPD
jgi:hypothetical protein